MINLTIGKFSFTLNFPRWSFVLIAAAAIYAASVPNQFSDGETLSAAKLNDNFTAAASPSGTIVAFGGTTAPSGWLLCNGATVSRSTYASLFAAISTNFGAGDGSSTFHLPDLRGRFLRGRDTTAGRDPDVATRTASNSGGSSGDAVGSLQGHQFEDHVHKPAPAANLPTSSLQVATAAGWSALIYGNTDNAPNTSNPVSGNHGSETRPVNVYVNYIIKQ